MKGFTQQKLEFLPREQVSFAKGKKESGRTLLAGYKTKQIWQKRMRRGQKKEEREEVKEVRTKPGERQGTHFQEEMVNAGC